MAKVGTAVLTVHGFNHSWNFLILTMNGFRLAATTMRGMLQSCLIARRVLFSQTPVTSFDLFGMMNHDERKAQSSHPAQGHTMS